MGEGWKQKCLLRPIIQRNKCKFRRYTALTNRCDTGLEPRIICFINNELWCAWRFSPNGNIRH